MEPREGRRPGYELSVKIITHLADGSRHGEKHHAVVGVALCVVHGDEDLVAPDNAPDDRVVGKPQVAIRAFVAGEFGLTMNSSTSASLPVRHLIACTSVDIVKRKMFDAVTSFLLMIVSMPIDSARLM